MGTSLAVRWLRLCAPNAGAVDLIPGGGNKIPQAAPCDQKKKKKKVKMAHFMLHLF